MADPIDLTTKANAPAEIEQDGTRVKQQPISGLIEADRYLAGKTAATNKRTGLRFFKLVPPGST